MYRILMQNAESYFLCYGPIEKGNRSLIAGGLGCLVTCPNGEWSVFLIYNKPTERHSVVVKMFRQI